MRVARSAGPGSSLRCLPGERDGIRNDPPEERGRSALSSLKFRRAGRPGSDVEPCGRAVENGISVRPASALRPRKPIGGGFLAASFGGRTPRRIQLVNAFCRSLEMAEQLTLAA